MIGSVSRSHGVRYERFHGATSPAVVSFPRSGPLRVVPRRDTEYRMSREYEDRWRPARTVPLCRAFVRRPMLTRRFQLARSKWSERDGAGGQIPPRIVEGQKA